MLRRSTSLYALPACSFVPPPYSGPSYEKVLAQRQKYLNPVSFLHYKKPLLLNVGHKQYLYNHENHRYLDLFGGVTTVGVGHSHPRITKVVAEQAAKINHTTTLYLHPNICEYAEAFASKLPKQHEWTVHITNSGSEANDFAMLMARVYTKNQTYVSLRNGYHGFTEGSRNLVSVPNWKYDQPTPGAILRLQCPHPYHGWLGTKPEDVDKYIAEAEEVLKCETGGRVAGFVAERIQGVGGTVPLMDGYLPKMYEIIRKHGGVCISDEVQCGFGRLGTAYWGFEHAGVVPDMVVCAKSVANGWSVGVVACRKEISDAAKGVLYFNTFGGNAICSAVALETLKIIEDEKLQDNCKLVGDRITAGLSKLAEKHQIIGDIRGAGLLRGFELVKDRKTKAPATAETAVLHQELFDKHDIVIGKGGPNGNVIRIHPPMCMTVADADHFVTSVDSVLSKL